jgi:hypothetical protein
MWGDRFRSAVAGAGLSADVRPQTQEPDACGWIPAHLRPVASIFD